MSGRECYHCKLWIDEGEAHDCWTTTEQALTQDLAEDLRDAWERLREAMLDLGEQRVYASGTCIMFSRQVCHVFVRPKRKVLEVCIFLGRALADPRVRRAERSTKVKFANILHLTHRDEVEPPLTDWLREAYRLQDTVVAARTAVPATAMARTTKAKAKATSPARGATRARPTAAKVRAATRKSRAARPKSRG